MQKIVKSLKKLSGILIVVYIILGCDILFAAPDVPTGNLCSVRSAQPAISCASTFQGTIATCHSGKILVLHSCVTSSYAKTYFENKCRRECNSINEKCGVMDAEVGIPCETTYTGWNGTCADGRLVSIRSTQCKTATDMRADIEKECAKKACQKI